MAVLPSLGSITHLEYDVIVGSFFLFVLLVILFHFYLKWRHKRWIDDGENRLFINNDVNETRVGEKCLDYASVVYYETSV